MKKKKIMLVDDEVDFLRILKLNLENKGYEVVALSSAKNIVEDVDKHKPDCLLLDLLMPDIGGMDACQMLNNNPLGSKTPIIILSALSKDIDKFKAYELGVLDYITKPVEIDTLISAIEKVTSPRGFTLIELMLVVIIIGALVAMVMPRLTGRTEQARAATAEADIRANIATALKLYELDNGIFPTTEEGLNALLNKPGSSRKWNGPYLEKQPIDPWGREYKYKSPGSHRADYDLYSLGRDGQEGTEDDVKNWE